LYLCVYHIFINQWPFEIDNVFFHSISYVFSKCEKCLSLRNKTITFLIVNAPILKKRHFHAFFPYGAQCTAHCKDIIPKIRDKYARKGIAGPQSQFPHSCVCERFIYSHGHRPAYSAEGKYVDRSWVYINRSQTH